MRFSLAKAEQITAMHLTPSPVAGILRTVAATRKEPPPPLCVLGTSRLLAQVAEVGEVSHDTGREEIDRIPRPRLSCRNAATPRKRSAGS